MDGLKNSRRMKPNWNFYPTWRSHAWEDYLPAGSSGQKAQEKKGKGINIY